MWAPLDAGEVATQCDVIVVATLRNFGFCPDSRSECWDGLLRVELVLWGQGVGEGPLALRWRNSR